MITSCRDLMKPFERHIRSSHAIGKFIVDGAVGRLWSTLAKLITPESGGTQGGQVPNSDTEQPARTNADAGTALPLSESDFALLTSAEVVDLIARSTDSEVRAIGDYEQSHRRRRLVLQAVSARCSA